MKRYDTVRCPGPYVYPGSCMSECRDGVWVLAIEAEAEIARLHARVVELIDECDELAIANDARVVELIDECDELAIANDRLRNYYPVRQLNAQRAQLGLPEWP